MKRRRVTLFPSMNIYLLPLPLSAQNEGHNEAVQTQGLCKNQNQNVSNVQFWLAPDRTDTGVANDADCQARA